MSFRSVNDEYEAWLATQCSVVTSDLDYKHKRMRKNAFVFLRATYFRWAGQIEKLCPELKTAPPVLSVGDLHLENFGTWRDAEGRLVWGVDDFDEAASIAYPFDLVRLAASARLAPGMAIGNREAAAAIIEGYGNGLAAPRPTLLDEQETWLRPYVACSDEDRKAFWQEVDDYPQAVPPADVTTGLRMSLPDTAEVIRFCSRVKGGGSLGRPRYVVIAAWRGGRIVREAKALVPSAWTWAHGVSAPPSFLQLATGRYRSPDPFLDVRDGFVFRRIAADSRKVGLGDDAGSNLKIDLLRAMGFDLGSIHATDPDGADAVRRDLKGRPPDWLQAAAKTAAAAVQEDWESWRT
jgi:hypothetical protein